MIRSFAQYLPATMKIATFKTLFSLFEIPTPPNYWQIGIFCVVFWFKHIWQKTETENFIWQQQSLNVTSHSLGRGPKYETVERDFNDILPGWYHIRRLFVNKERLFVNKRWNPGKHLVNLYLSNDRNNIISHRFEHN